jgi:sec-independent protein translocase protein TatB
VFDVGFGELAVLLLAGLFVFGPDRLPQVVSQAARLLRQLRAMAAGARAELNDAIGPELRELNVLSDLDDLRRINPRTALTRMLSDDGQPAAPAGKGVGGDGAGANGQAGTGSVPPGSPGTSGPAAAGPVYDPDAT